MLRLKATVVFVQHLGQIVERDINTRYHSIRIGSGAFHPASWVTEFIELELFV